MSQTETILLIVLGFSLASLIALFLGRMVWTMGVKLGARRMHRQVPSSLVGLQTERDRLRADIAGAVWRGAPTASAVGVRLLLPEDFARERVEDLVEVHLVGLLNNVHCNVLCGVGRVLIVLKGVALLRLVFFRRLLSSRRPVDVVAIDV